MSNQTLLADEDNLPAVPAGGGRNHVAIEPRVLAISAIGPSSFGGAKVACEKLIGQNRTLELRLFARFVQGAHSMQVQLTR
jgi:hypothetical protein